MFPALLRRVLTLGVIKHCLVSVMFVHDAVTTFEVMYLDFVQRLEMGPFPGEDDVRDSYSD